MFTAENIEILSKHTQIIHHIKGRIRLKIDAKIQRYEEKIDLAALGTLDKKADGIKSVSLNKIAKSLTIEYDPVVIDKGLWDELANSLDYETTANKLNQLIRKS